jgi:hypothetical protein
MPQQLTVPHASKKVVFQNNLRLHRPSHVTGRLPDALSDGDTAIRARNPDAIDTPEDVVVVTRTRRPQFDKSKIHICSTLYTIAQ